MKLYVGNLSYDTVEDTLKDLFSNYGEVISVKVMKDKFTQMSKGFAFVEMSDETYERAIGGTNGKDVDGRRIRVTEAVEKPNRGGARKSFGHDGEKRGFSERHGRFGHDRKNDAGRSDRPGRFGEGRFHGKKSGGQRDERGEGFGHGRASAYAKSEDAIPSNEY